MPITINEVTAIVQQFYTQNHALNDTKFLIYKAQSDIQNDAYQQPKYQGLQGAYLPKDNKVLLIVDNHNTKNDILQTLKHEVYGHATLYKLSHEERKALLYHIHKLKNHKDFKVLYEKIEAYYFHSTDDYKAEEIYAYIAEKNPFGYKAVESPTIHVKSLKDIQNLAQHLQNEIISGHKKQKDIRLDLKKSITQKHKSLVKKKISMSTKKEEQNKDIVREKLSKGKRK